MADSTYVPTAEGWLYVASLEDLDPRKIVGWAAGSRIAPDLNLTALGPAVHRYRPPAGVLHHSDRGNHTPLGTTRPGSPGAPCAAA